MKGERLVITFDCIFRLPPVCCHFCCRMFTLPPTETRLITPGEAESLMSRGLVQYLDVRTPEEFALGHPPGASNVPFQLREGAGMRKALVPNPGFAAALEKTFPNKLTPLVVGCKSGARSTPALVMMLHAGYADVRNQNGGFDAWVKAGLPSVSEVVAAEE